MYENLVFLLLLLLLCYDCSMWQVRLWRVSEHTDLSLVAGPIIRLFQFLLDGLSGLYRRNRNKSAPSKSVTMMHIAVLTKLKKKTNLLSLSAVSWFCKWVDHMMCKKEPQRGSEQVMNSFTLPGARMKLRVLHLFESVPMWNGLYQSSHSLYKWIHFRLYVCKDIVYKES
jgi:hypothetical protein